MVRAIGMSARGLVLSVYGLEDGKPYMRASYSPSKMEESVEEVISLVGDVDAVVIPSGYGLPVERLMECDEEDFSYLYLVRKGDKSTGFLEEIMKLAKRMAKECPNSFVIPSVIELDSIPEYRKVNLIDMGTSDTLCSAVLAVKFQADSLGIDYKDTSFLLADLGYESNSFLAVEGGRIVDGVGGGNCKLGFMSMGGMDLELAYLLGGFEKVMEFKSGLAEVSGCSEYERAKQAKLSPAYIEGIVKDAASLLHLFKPREVLVSGGFAKDEAIGYMEKTLGLGVRKVKGFSEFKLVAQGAAIVADGIAGGKFEGLVKHMRIFDANGTVLDHLYPNWLAERVKASLLHEEHK